MQSALHITTKVLPGNKIEIEIPEAQISILNAGDRALHKFRGCLYSNSATPNY